MIIDNRWYGHRKILAEYCGLADRPAFATIQHGWNAFRIAGEGFRRIETAPYLVWRKDLQDDAVRDGVKNVRAIGAPFLYLLNMIKTLEAPTTDDRGTIVFPQHSSPAFRASYDVAAFIAAVRLDNPSPFTVSIGHFDLANESIVKQYRQAGFRVVSFGSRASQRFLYDLYGELRAHSTVVANYTGSGLFYGMALGKRARLRGARPTLSAEDEVMARTHEVIEHRYPQLRREGISAAAARKIASVELGLDCMKEPGELARILGWTSPVKRAGARVLRQLFLLKYGRGAFDGHDEESILKGRRFG